MLLNLLNSIVPAILTSIPMLLGYVYKVYGNRTYLRRGDENLLRSINAICDAEHIEIKKERNK